MTIISCIRELRKLYNDLESREDSQRYGHANKALEDKWLSLKKIISNKCELNDGMFTLKYRTRNGFYSSEKAKMYFYHRQVTTVGTSGIYILLFLNHDEKLTITLTQGRKGIADKYDGDENRAEAELAKIAIKYSKKYKNELCEITNIKIKSSDDIGVRVASKEFNLNTITERDFIDDFTIFQKIYSDIADNEGELKTKNITRNIRDSRFKRLLLERVGQCLITGCKIRSVLEGAHIIPHSETQDDSIDNGLLLRADIHKLYDSNLLGIDGDGKLHFSSLLLDNNYIRCKRIAEEIITPKMKKNLNKKFKSFIK